MLKTQKRKLLQMYGVVHFQSKEVFLFFSKEKNTLSNLFFLKKKLLITFFKKQKRKPKNSSIEKFIEKEDVLVLLDEIKDKEYENIRKSLKEDINPDLLVGRSRTGSFEFQTPDNKDQKASLRQSQVEEPTTPEMKPRNSERTEKINSESLMKILGFTEDESKLPLEKFVPPPILTFEQMISQCLEQSKEKRSSFLYAISAAQDTSYPSQSILTLEFPFLPHATRIYLKQ